MNAWECVFMTEMVGLSPLESIRSATLHAARLLRQDDLGHLDVGAHADVIVVPDDPLDDISAVTRVSTVVAAGEVARAS
jgi:imidazolonepropionase-like amidohydrolase